MKIKLLNILKLVSLYIIYGLIYYIIECIWKQNWSDYRMFLLAGFLGICIGLLNNIFSWDTSFILQCFVGSLMTTLSEAIVGIYLLDRNIQVWSYNNLPFSFCHGTVNLFFSIIWFILSGICIILDDYLRYWLFKEEKPHYRL